MSEAINSVPNSTAAPLLGAHVSIAGGVGEALPRGAKIGAQCLQIFTKSSRQWASRAYSKDDVALFRHNQNEHRIGVIVAHGSYLLNLSAPDEKLRRKSVGCRIDEPER